MQIVLDASYLMEFLENPEWEIFQWIWENEPVAPCLLRYEYNNILLCKLKNSNKTINQFRNVIHNLSIRYIDIAGEEEGIMPLAINYRLSFYDASYLHIAMEKGIPIATYDKDLIRAAKEKNVEVIE
ncbi:MAG: type II toxin-antitoxin system VapC family toxin [Puniceicoccales bacterium]|jgi:predicted nucleic acid-binding protein|nr:type II toxin-antitoxin system VapC family toxin [Puniceicoccales bacterium]